MEEILPKALVHLIVQITRDNKLLNWRIFGGQQTTICIKYESMEGQPLPTPEKPAMHGEHYRRKSPSTVTRDMKRISTWCNRDNSVSTDQYVNTGQYRSDSLQLNDSGICNGINVNEINDVFCQVTTPENIQKDVCYKKKTNSREVEVQTSCDVDQLIDSSSQTDPLQTKNTASQIKMLSKSFNSKPVQSDGYMFDKYSQTGKVQTYNKCVQHVLAMKHVPVQTSTMVDEKSIMVDFQTPGLCDVATTTNQPLSKHVQTYQPKMKDFSAVAKGTLDKSSQTYTKKELKQQHLECLKGQNDPQISDSHTGEQKSSETSSDKEKPVTFDLVLVIQAMNELTDKFRKENEQDKEAKLCKDKAANG